MAWRIDAAAIACRKPARGRIVGAHRRHGENQRAAARYGELDADIGESWLLRRGRPAEMRGRHASGDKNHVTPVLDGDAAPACWRRHDNSSSYAVVHICEVNVNEA